MNSDAFYNPHEDNASVTRVSVFDKRRFCASKALFLSDKLNNNNFQPTQVQSLRMTRAEYRIRQNYFQFKNFKTESPLIISSFRYFTPT